MKQQVIKLKKTPMTEKMNFSNILIRQTSHEVKDVTLSSRSFSVKCNLKSTWHLYRSLESIQRKLRIQGKFLRASIGCEEIEKAAKVQIGMAL